MSDKIKVEPAKAVDVVELKKQVNNLSAYVRKIVKRLEHLGGIDIDLDGKVGLLVIGLITMAAVGFASDTLITGYPQTTGIGTFKVVSDGSVSTLTVDKIVVTSSATGPFGTNTATGALSSNLVALGGTTGSFQFLKPGGTTGTVYYAAGIITNSP